jgi:hypothetical protein
MARYTIHRRVGQSANFSLIRESFSLQKLSIMVICSTPENRTKSTSTKKSIGVFSQSAAGPAQFLVFRTRLIIRPTCRQPFHPTGSQQKRPKNKPLSHRRACPKLVGVIDWRPAGLSKSHSALRNSKSYLEGNSDKRKSRRTRSTHRTIKPFKLERANNAPIRRHLYRAAPNCGGLQGGRCSRWLKPRPLTLGVKEGRRCRENRLLGRHALPRLSNHYIIKPLHHQTITPSNHCTIKPFNCAIPHELQGLCGFMVLWCYGVMVLCCPAGCRVVATGLPS